jgi:hypothetical protein
MAGLTAAGCAAHTFLALATRQAIEPPAFFSVPLDFNVQKIKRNRRSPTAAGTSGRA